MLPVHQRESPTCVWNRVDICRHGEAICSKSSKIVHIIGARGSQILTTLTRDIQCEKFIEDESVSYELCDSMYPNIC